MDYILLVPLFLILILGVILTAIGLFGNVVIFGSAVVYAVLTHFIPIGLKEILILGVLYGTGELLEYVFTIIGVRWLGASKLASWMAILGTIIGAIGGGAMFLGVGVVIGGFVGAVCGALITEFIIKGEFGPALKAGLGAFVGKVGAIFLKLIIAIIMIVYITKLILLW